MCAILGSLEGWDINVRQFCGSVESSFEPEVCVHAHVCVRVSCIKSLLLNVQCSKCVGCSNMRQSEHLICCPHWGVKNVSSHLFFLMPLLCSADYFHAIVCFYSTVFLLASVKNAFSQASYIYVNGEREDFNSKICFRSNP